MTRERFIEIRGFIKEWSNQGLGIEESLFILYDDRMINALELEIMHETCRRGRLYSIQ